MSALVLLVVCIVSVWTLYLSPTRSYSLFFDRHQLPQDVPLPDEMAFVSFHTITGQLVFEPAWLWTSTDSPAAVQQFYLSHLGGSGDWLQAHPAQRGPEDLLVSAQGTLHFTLLSIEAQAKSNAATAPPGGSVISITIAHGP